MELWHNPRCSKSRSAKQILDDADAEYTERRYVDNPPTAAELDRVLIAMGKEPWEIARLGEPVAAELGLKNWEHDRDEVDRGDGRQPDPDRAPDPRDRRRPCGPRTSA